MNDGNMLGNGPGTGPESASHATLKWAVRTTCIAGFVGLAAIQYFARADRTLNQPTLMARSEAGGGIRDPETTGSIGQGARLVRLDPCLLKADLHHPRP